MFLLNLILFIGLIVGEVYLIEYLLPPFAKFYYTDIFDIMISFIKDLTIKFDLIFGISLSTNIVIIIVSIGLSIIPFLIVLFLNLSVKRRKKTQIKYKFK